MPEDRFSMNVHDDDHDLVAALRDLPLATPKRSVFAELERELAAASAAATPAPRRMRGAWIALAATFVVALAGVRLFHPQADDVAPPVALPSPDTLALIAQSQQLDDMLATLDARSVPIDAESAMASAELENLIGLTDLQLNAADRDDEAQALWSRRVDLMTRLAATRAGSSFNTLTDNGGASLQNASYRID
jgi:hypothetical protein